MKKRQSPDFRSPEVGISAVMKSGAPLLGLAKYIYIKDAIPYGEMPKWGQTARFLINTKQKLGLSVKSENLKKPPSEEVSWQQQLADELHKPIKRNFTRRSVIAYGIDKIWCSDLVEMQQFNKSNKGYRYLLMVLDLFSKYGLSH